MPANGTNALDSLLWGTSSAGSAVAAESTSTLGVDRTDVRVPVDQNHMWGAQVSAMKNLLLAMSATFKSGCRLGVSTQTASPFAANEQGWWVDTSGNAKFSYGGVANTLLAPALSTKGDLITYTGSVVAVQGTGGAGNDGKVLTADSTQANGIKWATAGGVSWPLTNGTSGNTYNSAVTDSGAAVAHDFNTTNSFATNGDFVFRIRSNSTAWFTAGRLNSQNAFTFTGSTDANGAGPVFISSPSSHAGIVIDSTGGGGRKFAWNSITTGLLVLADLTAAANRWQMDNNGAFAPFTDNAFNLGLPSTNRIGGVYTVRTEALRFTSPVQTIAAASSTTITSSSGGNVRVTLGTNITTLTFAAGVDGETMTVALIQDATGSRTIPAAGSWVNAKAAGGAFTLTSTANKRDLLTFRYLATDSLWYELARAQNQ